MADPSYPALRMRRGRSAPWMRDMLAEHRLHPSDLILPMFVHQVLALRKGCEGYTPRAQNFNLNFEDLSCK